MTGDRFDLICLGSGPAGQKAAIQASKAGFRAAVIEREPQIGGSCLLTGTIPSKALREQALRFRRMRGAASSLAVELKGDAPLSALLDGVEAVIAAQDRYLQAQLARNDVALIRGRATFLDAHCIRVQRLDGRASLFEAPHIVLATGSRPRHVPGIEVDHEHILDSDSVLSLPYLPRSLVVLGSGVIACEYASIFAALGCAVVLADKAAEPLGFLDAPLRAGFLSAFVAMGGNYRGGADVHGARFDGVSQVEVELAGGELLRAEIVLAAFGRIANLDGIGLDRLGLAVTSRGHVEVDDGFRTSIAGVYAAGDAIGPPALACAAADQGRRAALAALGLTPITAARVDAAGKEGARPREGAARIAAAASLVPTGVYTIPEIGCVGLSQREAAARNMDVVIGRADFSEVARAHIAGEPAGFLSLLCDRASGRVLGVQALGEGATDLVHLGQAAIASGATSDFFVEQIFNFPTMAETYRVAAFDVMKQRAARAVDPVLSARAGAGG